MHRAVGQSAWRGRCGQRDEIGVRRRVRKRGHHLRGRHTAARAAPFCTRRRSLRRTLRANSQVPSPLAPAAEADLHVVADHLGVLQEPLCRELVEAAADDRGHLRLVRSEALGRFGLSEFLFLDRNGDLGGELGLREGLLRLGHAHVGEDVPAAHGDGIVFLASLGLHGFPFALVRRSWFCFANLSLDLIRSRSGFGVPFPDLDFFWKTWSTYTTSPRWTLYTAR